MKQITVNVSEICLYGCVSMYVCVCFCAFNIHKLIDARLHLDTAVRLYSIPDSQLYFIINNFVQNQI